MLCQVLRDVCTGTAEAKISSRTVRRVLTAGSTAVSVAVTLVAQIGAAFLHMVLPSFWSFLNKECDHTGVCVCMYVCVCVCVDISCVILSLGLKCGRAKHTLEVV
jgi:hypothetical protein